MKYIAVVEYIKKNIESGAFTKGKRLPSIRNLARELGYNKATIIKAYEVLESGHLIYSIPKSGYYLTSEAVKNDETGDIIDFSRLIPDEKLLPFREFNHCINRAVETHKNSLFTYGETMGLPALRQALSDYFKSQYIYAKAQNICITNGAHQAISILAGMNFPNGKTKILIEQPTYNEIYPILENCSLGCELVRRDEKGLNFDYIEKAFKAGVKLFYTMPRHHNPLGTHLPKKQMIKLLALAEKYDVYIAEDDYLAEIKTEPPTLPLHYYDTHGRVIYIRSFSKSFMPGIRMGCAVLSDKLADEFAGKKRSSDLNTSPLIQGALELYISNGMYKAHIEKINRAYKEKSLLLKAQLSLLDGERVYISKTGSVFFFLMHLPGKVNSKIFSKNLLKAGIRVADGSQFFKEKPRQNCLRLSIASLSGSQIRHGINTIFQELDKLR